MEAVTAVRCVNTEILREGLPGKIYEGLLIDF